VVTVLFADIRGFTGMAENLEPQEVVDQLNEYLQTMTPIIFANHGTIDKFVGDEIMAYFGAPVYPEEHAWRAVKTAIEMQAALEELRRKWRHARRPDIRIGVGVNTGSVVMGNIGSSQYMDFTLIGDAVNVASRLCSIAEPGEVLVGASTLHQVADRVSVVRSRETTIKGRVHPVTVHSVTAIVPI
jgi:adenylate cyclase